MTKGKELVVVKSDQYAAVLMEKPIAEIIAQNLGAELITAQDLDSLPIPSGGGTTWEFETIDGEVAEKEVFGIIVFTHLARVYWEKSFEETGGGSPPDCVSDDGITGHGAPADLAGGECAKCPFSEFGSAKNGRAQACQQRRFFFVVLPGSAIPYVLSAPPSSLKNAKKFLLRLGSNGVKYFHKITKFTLDPDKNVDGIKFSKVNFSVAGNVDNPEFWEQYSNDVAPMLQKAAKDILRDQTQDPESE